VWIGWRRGRGRVGLLGRPDQYQRRLHVGIRNVAERLPRRVVQRRQGRQAPLRVIAVLGQVLLYQRRQKVVFVRRQRAAGAEEVAERLALVEHPGVHGVHERVLADEVQLEGEDAEQQVAVGGRRHGQASAKT